MYKKSKVFVAAALAVNMLGNSSMAVLAQDFPADSEEVLIEDSEESTAELSEAEISLEEDGRDDGETDVAIWVDDSDETESSGEITADSDVFTLTSGQQAFKDELREYAPQLGVDSLIEGKDYVQGEVIALADSLEQAQLIAASYGGELRDYGYGVATISLEASDYTVAEAYKAGLDANNNLPAVEPNFISGLIDPTAEFGDEADFASYNGNGWDRSYYEFDYNDPALNPNNDYERYQWFHDAVHTYAAWGLTTGDPDITVAVIDTGVLSTHEDLKGRVILPKDLTLNYNHGDDRDGHGTHVAGIIAAAAGNGAGGAGIAPGVKILAINASFYNIENGKYEFDLADEVTAINYVAGIGKNGGASSPKADIINMSLGGNYYSKTLETAVKKATDAGVTVVASMGNSYSNDKSYPAAFENTGVIAVAATDESGKKAAFSSFGPWCDVAAPGTNIYSTSIDKDERYISLEGTSMATPIVSGACALYMSVYGHQKPAKMEEIVKASVSKTSSKGIGTGIIDLAKMFGGEVNAPTISIVRLNGSIQKELASASGNSVTVKDRFDPNIFIKYSTDYLSADAALNKQAKIVYTLDGKNPAVKNGVVTVGETLDYSMWYEYPRPIRILNYDFATPTTITLKAAFLSGTGVLSKVTTIKFTVADEQAGGSGSTQWIYVDGQNSVTPGSGASFKAVFYENSSKTRTVKARPVDWSVDKTSEDAGVTISAAGKLTVPVGISLKGIEVKAVCKDNDVVTGIKYLEFVSEKAASVIIDVTGEKSFNDVKRNAKTGLPTNVTLFSSDIDGTGFKGDERRLQLEVRALNKEKERISIKTPSTYFGATSSNNKIVAVEKDEKTGKFSIAAVSAGTATVTFKALDGSKKKSSIKVKVITPASGVTLTTAGNQTQNITFGKSATAVASLGSTYGKPSVNKVNWTYKVGFYNANYEKFIDDEDTAKAIMKLKAFSFSKGKITAGKITAVEKAMAQYSGFGGNYPAKGMIVEVIAQAADKTGYFASQKYYIDSPRSYLYINENKNIEIASNCLEIQYSYPIESDGTAAYEVTSSDPEVASAYSEGWLLYVTSHKTGTATITIRALDGSGMTRKIKCTVK